MSEAQAAAFNFENFVVTNFAYNDSQKEESSLRLKFTPSGKFYGSEGRFDIYLHVTAADSEDDNIIVVDIKTISTFKFDVSGDLSIVPTFFYKNSIAIVFPYIRSFISTLTLQANNGLIVLGLMNLSGMEAELRENTIQIEK